jgi:septum formation inhibitor-activating ATPase MinD
MVGSVSERDQLMLMGRSPNVIYTCVTLKIIAEDVFLSTAQIRDDIYETLCLLRSTF